MVRVFKSTKREDIVARELQKQEIYTEKRTDKWYAPRQEDNKK